MASGVDREPCRDPRHAGSIPWLQGEGGRSESLSVGRPMSPEGPGPAALPADITSLLWPEPQAWHMGSQSRDHPSRAQAGAGEAGVLSCSPWEPGQAGKSPKRIPVHSYSAWRGNRQTGPQWKSGLHSLALVPWGTLVCRKPREALQAGVPMVRQEQPGPRRSSLLGMPLCGEHETVCHQPGQVWAMAVHHGRRSPGQGGAGEGAGVFPAPSWASPSLDVRTCLVNLFTTKTPRALSQFCQ